MTLQRRRNEAGTIDPPGSFPRWLRASHDGASNIRPYLVRGYLDLWAADPVHARAFTLRTFGGYSWAEIARAMEFWDATYPRRLHAAAQLYLVAHYTGLGFDPDALVKETARRVRAEMPKAVRLQPATMIGGALVGYADECGLDGNALCDLSYRQHYLEPMLA